MEFENKKVIIQPGTPVSALHLITKGSVKVSYPGGEYIINKGDCIGISEICSEIHFLQYTALEDITTLTYPISNMESFGDFLEKQPDIAKLFCISIFHQINTIMSHCETSAMACTELYQNLKTDYESYCKICTQLRESPKTLKGIDEIETYLSEETADMWLHGFYVGLLRAFASGEVKSLLQSSSVSLGFIRKASLDYRRAFLSLEEQFNYQQSLTNFYFNQSRNDLFEYMTSLYYKVNQNSSDGESLYSDIKRMILHVQKAEHTSLVIKDRTEQFLSKATLLNESSNQNIQNNIKVADTSEFFGSLNIILDFVGDISIVSSFKEHIIAFKSLSDRNDMSEETIFLRKQLQSEFNTLYAAIFIKTLSQKDIPIPVRMFLNFGYVDEELAGIENSAYLYSLVKTLGNQTNKGVYTFYEWLLAIYRGEKEPSRNEFGQEFSELHKGENDPMKKVIFELENLFPLVNKITFGRLTTYCPVFCTDSILKDLSSCFVTASEIGKSIEQIRSIDYSAFYREAMDMNHLDSVGKEYFHFEYLPDVILMPNVGIRPVMWQEIQGKQRNTPARMFFSIFYMEDLHTGLIRLTGEYRWDICRRIQGSRWNDISDPSLTSMYFDYIQFYKKSHDLSNEAKEKVRTSLQRAKNSFKEMFIRDYILWILYEGNASPRLNKVARGILFQYCPFSSNICEKLTQNPLYLEPLQIYNFKRAQKQHRLKMIKKKLNNGGITIPDSLEKEFIFNNM